MKRVCTAVSTLLLAGMLFAQQTDWTPASNNRDIQFRDHVYERMKACDLEFKDLKQGTGYTSFDVAVDYNSTDLNSEGKLTVKTDSEHIVTTATHTGGSRIANCSAVVEARVSVVTRH